jgi:Domain of unknown function (DUF4328)
MVDSSSTPILNARHRRLHVALVASLVLAIIMFAFEIAELAGAFTVSSDPDVELTAIEGLYALVAIALTIVAVTTIILWCMWLHRAARNIVDSELTAFGFTPAWAVGWHFIPFANLFKPFEVMREIWNASVGHMDALDQPEPLVTRWWATWLSSSILGNISLRLSLNAETADAIYWATAIGAVSSILSLIAIPTAMKMLTSITEGQQQRFSERYSP